MKKLATFLLSLGLTFALIAQPSNDDCNGVIDLGEAPVCPSPGIYTNVNATESNIGNDNFPACFNGTPARDVWFSFVATAAFLDYAISVNPAGASPIMMPQMALYRGDCGFDELVLLDCAAAAPGENSVSIEVAGLTPGVTYFLRINDWSASASPNWGSFQLCVEENIQVSYTIDQGSSSSCNGELFDTGGASGNYGNNENHVFTICPSDPHDCIVFTLDNYNIQNGGDLLTFYDGPNANSPVIGNINGGAPTNGPSQGGVCYQVVATSGCLSVRFTSNSTVNYEGFQGHWECTTDCPEPGDLNVSVNPSFAGIAAAVANPLMDITVTNVNCNDNANGTFSAGDNTELGLDKGLLLTTGRASEVANPASFFANTDWNLGGDPELDFLNDVYGNGQNTADACVVEMDVFVKTDRLAFDYVFGSDEYKQQFSFFSNDVIGVLVSGPGITGLPGLNGQENIATLPTGNNTLVQIQTVNATNNWPYFRNNFNGSSIAYNGLTSGFMGQPKTLLAQKQVTPCQTYHVKIAIGDTDPNDDSGLFIAASSAGLPELAVNFQNGINYLVENCTSQPDFITISLPEPLTTQADFTVEIGGTATLGVDYALNLPSTISFPAGTTELTYPITPLSDLLVENTETIEITLIRDYGCGAIEIATVTLEVKDSPEVNIFPNQDTIFVCQGVNTAQLQATGAVSYTWAPAGIFDNPFSDNPVATINASQPVTVTGLVGACPATDVIFLQLVSPQVDIVANGITQLCQGDSVQLTATNNVSNSGLTWSPLTGLSTPASAVTWAKPFATTTYTATVTATGGCSASDEITVTVEPFDFPIWVSGDTLICQNSSVQLAAAVNNSTTKFTWTPATGLNNADIAGAIATPDQTTTYTLTATSLTGLCTDMASVTVTVLPADVDIAPETIELCLGDSVDIQAITSTNGMGLTWSPTDSLTMLNVEAVRVNPSYSTWYVATLEVGQCIVKDSIYVRVDSLPVLTMEAVPAKEMYCQGEIVSLISPNYPFLGYPDIMHQWMPLNGVISEDTLFNLVLQASETTTYVRTTTNHACMGVDSIEIVVVPVAVITITPEMPVVCAGQSVQLMATADQDIEEWEWTPAVGLSCTDCPNPMATPPASLTYQVTGEFMGCPAFATVFIEVPPAPYYQLPLNRTICLGESIVLNEITDPNSTYLWTTAGGGIVSTDPQPQVSPSETTTYVMTIDNGACDPVMIEITVRVITDYVWTMENADVTLCQGSEVIPFAAAEGVEGTTIWSHNGANGAPVIVNTDMTFVATFTDNYGCYTKTDSFMVMVVPPFFINELTAEPDTLYEGEIIDLMVSTEPPVLEGPSYTWLVDNVALEETTTNTLMTEAPQVDKADVYLYKVIIVDAYGCMAMDTVSVFVKNSAFDMPNVFSPNNDNLNDYFAPVKSDNVAILEFRIWDRWGAKVYDNENGNTGWDGKKGGEDMPSDVYIFYLRYNEGGVEKVLKGDVTLLR